LDDMRKIELVICSTMWCALVSVVLPLQKFLNEWMRTVSNGETYYNENVTILFVLMYHCPITLYIEACEFLETGLNTHTHID
jgi:cytochrome c biogenesis factor